jgi:hypothetical protein
MWPTRQQNPMQLAGMAVRGVVLYTLTLTVAVLTRHLWLPIVRPSGTFLHTIAAVVVALAVLDPGIVLMMRATSLLRRGVRAGRWPEEELAPLRRQVERPVWTAMAILFAGLIICLPLVMMRTVAGVLLFLLPPLELIVLLRGTMRSTDPSPTVLHLNDKSAQHS